MACGLSNGYVTDDVTWKVKKSRKRLDLETPFQWTTNRKWNNIMGYEIYTWPMTSRDTRKCCEAVRSAILATAWLLVDILFTILNNIMYHFIIVSCDIFLFFFSITQSSVHGESKCTWFGRHFVGLLLCTLKAYTHASYRTYGRETYGSRVSVS